MKTAVESGEVDMSQGKLQEKFISTGLKISMTGAFPGRSGTDTEFR